MYQPGISKLLHNPPARLKNQRVGLVFHAASTDEHGTPTPQLLSQTCNLEKAFCPEHGFASTGAAGEHIEDAVHPELGIPIYSLYGKTRKPTPEMLQDLDVLVYDLQDLGFRCYTYASTLRLVMEACSENGVELMVTDRPVPLPGLQEGPMLEADCSSFVGCIPAPLAFGMSSGELAFFLKEKGSLDLDLTVYDFSGYESWEALSPWIPPSPGIKHPATAFAYLTTVWTEALPDFDCGRHGAYPFQWLMHQGGMATALEGLPGWRVENREGHLWIEALDSKVIRPVSMSIHLLSALGPAVWESPSARPDFFDQLYGTRQVRESLLAGIPAADIIASW